MSRDQTDRGQTTSESRTAERPATSDVQMKWGVKIRLRDGVHLNATLYMPTKRATASPAIFTLTPYVGQTFHDQAVYFAAHGYPFLTVDVRGRGNSEGEFHPANDARDGHDVVEWLARQPYCNGKVAMWGGSYSGYVQWAVAKEFPTHLTTIVPVASPCRGVDSPMRNNVFLTYTMRWLTYLSGRCAQDKIFADQSFWSRQFKRWFEAGVPYKQLDTYVGNPSSLFQEWVSHPRRDTYWDSYNPTSEQYSKLSIPILTITGIYDGDQPGALAHYRETRSNKSLSSRTPHCLVIGPWDHAGTRVPKAEFCGLKVGPESLVDLQKLHLDWYDWTLQGGPRPKFLRNNVSYYVMGAEEWRYAETLEAVTAFSEPLFLQSSGNPTDVFRSGLLAREPPALSEPDHYVYDPRDVSLADLESSIDPESRVDSRMVNASVGKQLVYHSLPFSEDVEISGFFTLSLWLSIDQPDTDFVASIYEVGLDGGSISLTNDLLRARYRESLREEKTVCTQEPLRYDFNRFMFVARRVSKGHRLRLVFGPINSIYMQRNYNSGGVVAEESISDARPVTVRLFHDEAHPSVLHIPLGQAEV